MPFEIKYGGWIHERAGDKTVMITLSEDDMKRELKLVLMEGGDVDQAFAQLKQRIVAQMRKG